MHDWIMSVYLFRCPSTGFRVQAWSEEDSEDSYEAMTCITCQRVHLVHSQNRSRRWRQRSEIVDRPSPPLVSPSAAKLLFSRTKVIEHKYSNYGRQVDSLTALIKPFHKSRYHHFFVGSDFEQSIPKLVFYEMLVFFPLMIMERLMTAVFTLQSLCRPQPTRMGLLREGLAYHNAEIGY